MKRICSLATLALLGACSAVGPDYVEPARSMPEGYTSEIIRGLSNAPAELGAWWRALGDPELDRLVKEAVAGNLDLKTAESRIAEARASRSIVATQELPNVDVGGDYQRRQSSRETRAGSFQQRETHAFDASFDAFWEIDLWGRIKRQVEAADADIDAVIEDYRDLLVVMVAETARNYVDLRRSQDLLRIAHSNLEIQSKTVELSESRFNSGLVSQLDVVQAQTLLDSTRATIPLLEAGERAAMNRLAVLTGVNPGSLEMRLRTRSEVPIGGLQLAVGVPADLIRRRPDIRRSERQLAAQTARIGVAEAELYPKLSLLGSLGLSSDDFLSLFSRPAAIYSYGPSLSFNVFDRARLHAVVTIETLRQEQSLLGYEQTILLALEEVENAMTSFVRHQVRRDSLEKAVAGARKSIELSRDQYREGLVDFQGVLESQRSLFTLEEQYTQNRADISFAMIRLYKALGGGWEHFEPDAPASTEPESGSATETDR